MFNIASDFPHVAEKKYLREDEIITTATTT